MTKGGPEAKAVGLRERSPWAIRSQARSRLVTTVLSVRYSLFQHTKCCLLCVVLSLVFGIAYNCIQHLASERDNTVFSLPREGNVHM